MDVDQLAELIGRAQRRDPAAFDVLVEAYGSRMYGYFYRLTGSRHDAEDLLQELFVRLVRTIGDYRHDGRFDAWLFRIAMNLARDRIRRLNKSKRARFQGHVSAEYDGAETLVNIPDVSACEPSDQMQLAEQLDRLQEAIRRLPEPEREVILLRHFSGMPFRQIAELMGTPMGTALARAHRGLAKLRELMSEDGVQRE